LLTLVGVIAAATAGCRSADTTTKHRENDDIVLRMGPDVVRLADAQADLDRLPEPLRATLTSPEDRTAFVKKWINNQILIREAQRRGYDREARGAPATFQAMTLRVLKEHIDTEPTTDGISEADVQQYYREHPDEFGRPDEARVTLIVLDDRRHAEEILSRAQRLRELGGESSAEGATAELAGFRQLVFDHTQDATTKAQGGDLAITRDPAGKLHGPVPQAVARAAFLLEEPGTLSPLVEADGRYYVLKLWKRIASRTTSLEDARPRIQRRLAERNRERRVDELADHLASELRIQVFPERLLRLNFDVSRSRERTPG
jgi:hypothetical protein